MIAAIQRRVLVIHAAGPPPALSPETRNAISVFQGWEEMEDIQFCLDLKWFLAESRREVRIIRELFSSQWDLWEHVIELFFGQQGLNWDDRICVSAVIRLCCSSVDLASYMLKQYDVVNLVHGMSEGLQRQLQYYQTYQSNMKELQKELCLLLRVLAFHCPEEFFWHYRALDFSFLPLQNQAQVLVGLVNAIMLDQIYPVLQGFIFSTATFFAEIDMQQYFQSVVLELEQNVVHILTSLDEQQCIPHLFALDCRVGKALFELVAAIMDNGRAFSSRLSGVLADVLEAANELKDQFRNATFVVHNFVQRPRFARQLIQDIQLNNFREHAIRALEIAFELLDKEDDRIDFSTVLFDNGAFDVCVWLLKQGDLRYGAAQKTGIRLFAIIKNCLPDKGKRQCEDILDDFSLDQ